MATEYERELKAEIARLKKQLRESHELMRKTAVKIESMQGACASLRETVATSKIARHKRTNSR